MSPDLEAGARGTHDAIVVVDDAQHLTPEEFHAVTEQYSRPALMPGICADATAVATWTLRQLLERERDRIVGVEYYADGDKRESFKLKQIPLGELAAAFDRGEHDHWYLAGQDLDDTFPSVADELPQLTIVPSNARARMRSVFFGVETASATHFHTRDQAVLVQVRGKKRVVLAEPTAKLATNWTFGSRPHYSSYGPESGADTIAYFTELLGADPIVVDLSVGDALFIPLHWWHWVESTEETLSVTTFWRASYQNWVFPSPGFRALCAVGVSLAAAGARRAVSVLKFLPSRRN